LSYDPCDRRQHIEPSQQEYFERNLIVPQAKQLGAAIVADVADPAGHQSAVGKWRRLGLSPAS
jgi:hypothetical protein